MPEMYFDVDSALTEVPVNIMPLVDDTDFKTREVAIAYDAAGMDLRWNFVTSAGAYTSTAVTPTTGGDYDWAHQGDGMYSIEIPASGGASINNDTEGYGWFSGVATGVLPWRGPVIGFRRAALNDLLVDGGTASTNLEDFFDGTGYAGGTTKLDVNTATIAANAITATAINDGAITNAKVADDVDVNVKTITAGAITAAAIATDAIDADALAADASTELNAAVLAAIAGIGSGTGATLNFEVADDNTGGATGDTILDGITQLGTASGGTTFANTQADDGTYHTIASQTSGTEQIDWVYRFDCGGGRNASKVVIRAFMAAVSDTVTVQVYDHVGTDWETMGSITGTTETLYDIPLYAKHTGTGSAAGKVYVRFVFNEADAGTISIDLAYVQAQNLGQTIGYADGAIWIGGANTGTTPYVDGTADNPVTYAAALTLAAALGLTRFRVRNGTTVTLSASAASKSFVGNNWTLALGSQAIDGAYFEGASVSGTGTCTTAAEFVDCHIGAGTTVGPSQFLRCGFAGTSGSPFTAGSAGEFLFVDCFSQVAGSGTPYFTLSGASGINFRRWSGGSNITLNNTSATLTMEVVTGGGQTIATAGASVEIRGITRAVTLTGVALGATCQIDAITGPIGINGTGGTVNIYGVCGAVTDSSGGAVTINTFADLDTTANAILTDTAEIGTAGAGLTNINLPNQTMDIIGNITGNLSGSVGSVTGAVGSVTGAVGSVTGNVGGNVVGSVASVTADVDTSYKMAKNVAFSNFPIFMTDSTNHAPATSKTVSVYISKDGGSFAATTTATATEIAQGWYKINLTQTEMNADVIILRATATGCDDFAASFILQGD